MTRRPQKRIRRILKVLAVTLLVAVSAFAWSSVFGRLAPFVPWTFGYDRMETDRAVIYHHSESSTPPFSHIDEMVEEVEAFHELSFAHKPEIFICDTDAAYERVTGTNARFVAMPLQGRIYVSKRAETDYLSKRIRFDTYIKHELSHSLLYQNMTLFHTLTYPGWFLEGMAMVSSGQVGTDRYLSYEKARELLREGYFVEPTDWGTMITPKGESVNACPLANKFGFIYTEFAVIIDDLMTRHGKEAVIAFLKASLSGASFDEQFRIHFGDALEEVFAAYRRGGLAR